MKPEKYTHPSGDALLSVLGGFSTPLGDLVRAYPGSLSAAAGSVWLDQWFARQCANESPDLQTVPEPAGILSDELKTQLTATGAQVITRLTLCNVRPHHFRGFRALDQSIDLSGKLVVVEGRNSAGKTSLAEALEWLFTGQLQRRLDQEQGNPKELVDCIQSQLRPEGAETFVEAVFARDDGSTTTVRRRLVSDYGEASTSRCASSVTIDGQVKSDREAEEFFSTHFAAVPPLLMQHTLREFMHSGPTQRRVYFERLLNMNEITVLIEKAVVGDARLKDFPSPTGSRQLLRWTTASTRIKSQRARKLFRAAQNAPSVNALQAALLAYAQDDFSPLLRADATFQQARDVIADEQRRAREAQFPLLNRLTPTRVLDQSAKDALKGEGLRDNYNALRHRADELSRASEALTIVSEVERRLAPPVEALVSAGLLLRDPPTQHCPLCRSPKSLTSARVSHLLNVGPLVDAHRTSEKRLADTTSTLRTDIAAFARLTDSLVPPQPSASTWDEALKAAPEDIADAANKARVDLQRTYGDLAEVRAAVAFLQTWLDAKPFDPHTQLTEADAAVALVAGSAAVVEAKAQEYSAHLQTLVASVSTTASDATVYAERESWLDMVGALDELRLDLLWEDGKKSVQSRLSEMRIRLMLIRQLVLECRRGAFSAEMRAVWDTLRSDKFSQFKDLHIPPPSGKGYPVSIQVRATLDDGSRSVDVDALRVFSESQVNVLGIAAFLARSKLVGHSLVLLDDPVQSMDEEHFKTFADALTRSLLSAGLQVIILTHNDLFARDLSWAHAELDGYVSMELTHSRKKGCVVNEGSRRVPERLRGAERKAEDGDLKGAWHLIRVALERLYTLVKLKSDPSFKPESWLSAAAEHMWDQGVGPIIEAAVPGSGKQLKRILDETAAGAHDKAPRGASDVCNGCKYIRGLLTPLRVGG